MRATPGILILGILCLAAPQAAVAATDSRLAATADTAGDRMLTTTPKGPAQMRVRLAADFCKEHPTHPDCGGSPSSDKKLTEKKSEGFRELKGSGSSKAKARASIRSKAP